MSADTRAMRRGLRIRVLIVCLLAALASLLALTAAQAADDDAALVSLASVSNGCGGGVAGEDARFFDTLNYQGVNVSFREACNVHDACYSGAVVRDPFGHPPGTVVDYRNWSQQRCDDVFLTNMQTLCRRQIHDSPTFAKFEQARDDCEHGHGPILPPCTSLFDLIPSLVGNYAIGAEMAHRVVASAVTSSSATAATERQVDEPRQRRHHRPRGHVRQVGRDVTVTWTGEPRLCGTGTGTLVTRDQADELVSTRSSRASRTAARSRHAADRRKDNTLTFTGCRAAHPLSPGRHRNPRERSA